MFGNSYLASSGKVFMSSGTYYPAQEYYESSSEDLWDRMYIRPKNVIIVCGYCHAHNAISNPTCIQCGAPMGDGKERYY